MKLNDLKLKNSNKNFDFVKSYRKTANKLSVLIQ